MKNFILLTCLLFLYASSYGQKKGKEEILTYTTEDGTLYTVGDTVRFGMGSNTTGDFRFVYALPNFLYSYARFYNSSLNGKFATIDKMQKSGSDKMGYTMYFLFRYGAMGNSAINVESAITSGEMVTPASKKKAEAKNQPTIIQTSTISLADEIKKLKELLDAGVLTQAEYDAQKQKLLAK